jgi:hypothetical protein
MPIPKLPRTGKITKGEIIDLYIGAGWTNETLDVEWIDVNQQTGAVQKTVFRYEPATLPCSIRQCAQYQLTFLEVRPSGVFWSCGVCKRTGGPLAAENAIVVSRVVITNSEAWEIINRTSQIPPIGLDAISGVGGLEIIT